MSNDEILLELRDKVARIEVMLEQTNIQRDSAITDMKAIIKDEIRPRLDKVEANQTWLWRLCVSGLISGAIGLLFLYVR